MMSSKWSQILWNCQVFKNISPNPLHLRNDRSEFIRLWIRPPRCLRHFLNGWKHLERWILAHAFFCDFSWTFSNAACVFFVLQNENWLEAGGCPPKKTCLGAPIDQGGSVSWLAVPHRHWSLHRRHDFSMEVGVFWKLISKTHLQSVGCTPSFKMNGESPMTAFPNYVFALEAPNRFSAAWWNHCDIVLVWWHEPGWLNLMRLKVVKANPRPA